MNFLNLLTESNPNIVNILSIPFCIISTIFSLNFIQYIFDKKINTKQIILLCIFQTLITNTLNILFPNLYSYFINTIILPIICSIILKLCFLETCIAENIFIFIRTIANIFIYIFYNCFARNTICLEFIDIPLYIFLLFITEILLWYSTTFIIKKLKFNFKDLNNLTLLNSRKTFLKILIENIMIIILLLECIYITDINNQIINITNSFILIYFFLINFIHIKELMELQNSYNKIQNLEIYNNNLNLMYDELSSFKHDFNNIIQTIGGLLKIEKYDNLKKYYNGLQVECQFLNDIEKLNPTKINNPSIFTLLVNKYNLAKQNGIRMNIDIYSDLSKLDKNIFEIIRILGILLDNAIEACKDCKNKILNIEFRQENYILFIVIENTFIFTNIDTKNIFKKGFSTKKGNSGLGLWKVNKIIKKSDNLFLETFNTLNFFTQKLHIYVNP